MPIKFRCQFCRQLLGISRTRAGAVVDCPQCGRSLRVPNLDGTTDELPDSQRSSENDGALLSALSELTALAETDPSAESDRDDDRTQQASIQTADLNEPIQLDPIEQSEPLDVEPVMVPTVVAETNEDSESSKQESIVVLNELTETVDDNTVSFDVTEHHQGRQTGIFFAIAIGSVCFIVGGFCGWWLNTKQSTIQTKAAESDPESEVVDNDTIPPAAQNQQTSFIQGSVSFTSDNGNILADEGAMIFLLPSDRKGSLILDGRSLRRPTNHPDRLATVAALRQLGGDLQEADEDGRFSTELAPEDDYVLVIVSRHVQQNDVADTPSDVRDALEPYFGSDSHLPGKLESQTVVIKSEKVPDEPVNITF